MVEDVGLNRLIFIPYLVTEEEVYFYRQAEPCRLALCDDKVKTSGDYRMLPQVAFDIDAVEPGVAICDSFLCLPVLHEGNDEIHSSGQWQGSEDC